MSQRDCSSHRIGDKKVVQDTSSLHIHCPGLGGRGRGGGGQPKNVPRTLANSGGGRLVSQRQSSNSLFQVFPCVVYSCPQQPISEWEFPKGARHTSRRGAGDKTDVDKEKEDHHGRRELSRSRGGSVENRAKIKDFEVYFLRRNAEPPTFEN